ncbi:hypothetical protein E2I00_003972, partial [Balaenoptera physalus]
MSPSGRRMGEGRQQLGAPAGKRLLLPGSRGSPRGLPGGGGPGAQRFLLGLFVHAWLWAASGSSAQVFNLSLSVDEGLPPDTLVGDIRAGLPATQQQQEGGGFFLSEDSDDSPLLDDFHVHPDTGIIRTARRLDRERRDHYSFVAATLLGAVVQVEIRVNDVNDHSPRFPRDSLQLDVSELSPPGTAFRLPGAQDPDAGLFSIQGYTLAVAAHELQIEAWDGGRPRRMGSLRVDLRVLDENDNPPVFEQSEYRAAVREDALPGAEVCRRPLDREAQAWHQLVVEARDGGAEPEVATVRVSIAVLDGGERAFALRSGGSSGVFFLCVDGPLDRESRDLYDLRLVATDAGSPPLSTEKTLLLRVADLNDQPPLFSQENYRASVSEAAAPGTAVVCVSASDADEPGTDHARLRYALVPLPARCNPEALRPTAECGPFFSIDPEIGVISTTRSLDREVQEAVELRVVAQDLGEPPLSATCLVSITVDDVNDNEPIFLKQVYNATLLEHSPVSASGLWIYGRPGKGWR